MPPARRSPARGWDGKVTAESPAAAVFELFFAEMISSRGRRPRRRSRLGLPSARGPMRLPHRMLALRRIDLSRSTLLRGSRRLVFRRAGRGDRPPRSTPPMARLRKSHWQAQELELGLGPGAPAHLKHLAGDSPGMGGSSAAARFLRRRHGHHPQASRAARIRWATPSASPACAWSSTWATGRPSGRQQEASPATRLSPHYDDLDRPWQQRQGRAHRLVPRGVRRRARATLVLPRPKERDEPAASQPARSYSQGLGAQHLYFRDAYHAFLRITCGRRWR